MDYKITNDLPRGANWFADAYLFYTEKIVDFFERVLAPSMDGPENCRTIQELREYATSIQNKNPGFAADLFAAIDTAERNA